MISQTGIPAFLDASIYSDFRELNSLPYSGYLTLSSRSSFLIAESVLVNGIEYNFFETKISKGDVISVNIDDDMKLVVHYIHADIFLIARTVWSVISTFRVPEDLIIGPVEIRGKICRSNRNLDILAIKATGAHLLPSRRGFRASFYSTLRNAQKKMISPNRDFRISFVRSSVQFPLQLDFFAFGVDFAFSERLAVSLMDRFPDLQFDPILISDAPPELDLPW